ncbi:MAG TPA: hypothetical protein VNY81_05955 [Candidatus Saccharimonadales bacterium]|jgi:hypothetical protein|nr:hypothetical protein [Candidatus Saccharimonadales bacterium]
MKIATLFLLLLLATLSCAGPHPDEYSVKIHVTSSRWVVEPALDGPQARQKLTVTIGGSKKYELEAPVLKANLQAGVAVLALGDYKAKLVQDEHKSTYEFSRAYEFLFPDQKTRKFTVVGQFE